MHPPTLKAILRNNHRVQTKYEGIWTSENVCRRVCQQLFDLFGRFDVWFQGNVEHVRYCACQRRSNYKVKINKQRKKWFRTFRRENKKSYQLEKFVFRHMQT